jgi:hypothetical protein
MEDNLTNIMTAHVATWVTKAFEHLTAEQLKVVEATYADPEGDLRVVFRLKEGAIILEATKGDRRHELYRADVEPLRPRTGYGEPESAGGH